MIYISALGQFDNIGDTILRRAYLDILRLSDNLCVYVGDRSDGYVSGLGLHKTDSVVEAKSEWKRTLLSATVNGGAKLAFNTGELDSRGRNPLADSRGIAQLEINRLREGRAVHLGFGLREPDRVTALTQRYFSRFDLVSWRDRPSAAATRTGDVHPDWAFSFGSFGKTTREPPKAGGVCAVSLRYNSPPPDEEWISTVRRLASTNDLDIVAVPQVARDTGRAIEIYRQLGGYVVEWQGGSHLEHEVRVREAYSNSSVVISDRLHALIIGATEGAYPLGLVTSPAAQFKIKRTLASAGNLDAGVYCIRRGSDVPSIESLSELIYDREGLLRSVRGARSSLSLLSRKIGKVLSSVEEVASNVR